MEGGKEFQSAVVEGTKEDCIHSGGKRKRIMTFDGK